MKVCGKLRVNNSPSRDTECATWLMLYGAEIWREMLFFPFKFYYNKGCVDFGLGNGAECACREQPTVSERGTEIASHNNKKEEDFLAFPQ